MRGVLKDDQDEIVLLKGKKRQQFEIPLNRVKQNQHIFIAGDFNFPGWDWHNELLKPNCQNASLHEKF